MSTVGVLGGFVTQQLLTDTTELLDIAVCNCIMREKMSRVLSFQRGTYLPSSLEIMEEESLELSLRTCRRGHGEEQDRDDNHSAGTGLGHPCAQLGGRGGATKEWGFFTLPLTVSECSPFKPCPQGSIQGCWDQHPAPPQLPTHFTNRQTIASWRKIWLLGFGESCSRVCFSISWLLPSA